MLYEYIVQVLGDLSRSQFWNFLINVNSMSKVLS